MTAQKLPYRLSYSDSARRKNITYTSESTARHEAVRLSRRGHTVVYSELNRNGKYIDKETYAPSAPLPAR